MRVGVLCWTVKIEVNVRKLFRLHFRKPSDSWYSFYLYKIGRVKGQRLSQRLTQEVPRDGIGTSQGYYLWFIQTTAARAKICRVVPMVYYFIRGHSGKMFVALFPNKWIQPWHSAGILRPHKARASQPGAESVANNPDRYTYSSAGNISWGNQQSYQCSCCRILVR